MSQKEKLGELLCEKELISSAQLIDALSQQKSRGLPLGETLIELEYITENQLLKFLSRELNVDFINLSDNDFHAIDRSLINILPEEVCQRHKVLPVFLLEVDGERQITLAMSNPMDQDTITEIESLTGCHIAPALTISSDIDGGIKKLFGLEDSTLASSSLEHQTMVGEDRVMSVNRILAQAIQLEASDIHIEPHAGEAHVRYRIDGVLHQMQSMPLEDIPSTITRLKVMGSEHHSVMRLDKKNIPHEGSFARVICGHTVDFRVSTFPTIYGEKAALRVLDKNSRVALSTIKDLMMSPGTLQNFQHCIKQAGGIVVATGPTGSGKTTTLHTAINEINNVGLNIVTIEDPVEYHSGGFINQSNVQPQVGFTYPRALRSILRQDPDVIMVGEIRDLETAEIAVQAALTGHLVFTTMHTEDAAGAVVRLVDLGIEEFLVSCTVVSSINQRLMRKNCLHCAERYSPSGEEMADMGIDAEVIDEIITHMDDYDIKKGKGCSRCRNTGYRGRQGIYEFLSVTPAIKKMIRDKETSDMISGKAREIQQLNMLFEDGLRLVLSGISTFDELQRIPRGNYPLKPIQAICESADVHPATGGK